MPTHHSDSVHFSLPQAAKYLPLLATRRVNSFRDAVWRISITKTLALTMLLLQFRNSHPQKSQHRIMIAVAQGRYETPLLWRCWRAWRLERLWVTSRQRQCWAQRRKLWQTKPPWTSYSALHSYWVRSGLQSSTYQTVAVSRRGFWSKNVKIRPDNDLAVRKGRLRQISYFGLNPSTNHLKINRTRKC